MSAINPLTYFRGVLELPYAYEHSRKVPVLGCPVFEIINYPLLNSGSGVLISCVGLQVSLGHSVLHTRIPHPR